MPLAEFRSTLKCQTASGSLARRPHSSKESLRFGLENRATHGSFKMSSIWLFSQPRAAWKRCSSLLLTSSLPVFRATSSGCEERTAGGGAEGEHRNSIILGAVPRTLSQPAHTAEELLGWACPPHVLAPCQSPRGAFPDKPLCAVSGFLVKVLSSAAVLRPSGR